MRWQEGLTTTPYISASLNNSFIFGQARHISTMLLGWQAHHHIDRIYVCGGSDCVLLLPSKDPPPKQASLKVIKI